MKILTPLLLGLLFSSAAFASKSIRIELEPATTVKEKQARSEIIDSDINALVAELSDEVFPFNQPLNIIYGEGDGPFYDPESHTVYIPYTFYLESKEYFAKNKYEDRYGRTAKDGALDTLVHTLLHEAGHAYIEDQKIPVLGKEEDAVDNFATILLLSYVDNGDDIAISAADMFAFESEDRPEYYAMAEYAGEHSFDLQRYFATLCLVYGSDPEKYDYLLDEVDGDYLNDRKDYCTFNYQQISDNWHRYLAESK